MQAVAEGGGWVQEIHPGRWDAKRLMLGASALAVKVALIQVAFAFLSQASQNPLLRPSGVLLAGALILRRVFASTEGFTYHLDAQNLILRRRRGGAYVGGAWLVPLRSIQTLRPAMQGERLKVCYSVVRRFAPGLVPDLRMRLAFALSLISARAARAVAGAAPSVQRGWLIGYAHGQKAHACLIAPDEEMLQALAERLGDRFLWDDRLARGRVEGFFARSLQRAFPPYYPSVSPLIGEEDERICAEEDARLALRRETRRAEAGPGKPKTRAEKARSTRNKAAKEEKA